MAVYRSQKAAWEDSLRNHTKPLLLTHTTTALSTLDLSTVSLSGVQKSKNPDKKKSLGLAATLRHARAEQEAEETATGKAPEEEMEERGRKKARREETDGLVLGFDFDVEKKVVIDPEIAKEEKRRKKEEAEKKKEGLVKKVRKVVGRAFKGDREKRPKSKEGWWDDG